MSKNHNLFETEDNWVTKMGGSFPGERVVFRGKDLFSDLNEFGWMQILLYGITGKEYSQKQIRLFESIWKISASYPDPRIWNNRIASLGGTARSTGNLSIAAAIAASEATNYGQRPLIMAIDFLYDCQRRLDVGEDLSEIVFGELKTERMVAGFGRPIINKDERIAPLLELAKSLGFENGKYLKLIFSIEALLQSRNYRLAMNAAGLDAALAADQGLSPIEFYYFMALCFTAGFFPCHLESSQKGEGKFLPLRCERVSYEGIDNRKW